MSFIYKILSCHSLSDGLRMPNGILEKQIIYECELNVLFFMSISYVYFKFVTLLVTDYQGHMECL
jgi:hypothetical protein